MIYINEWFPNPVGPDASGEFVELYNSGADAASLGGWALSVGAKKIFKLDSYAVPAGGYLTLTRAETKLSLKNSDGEVLLYGPDGRIVDSANFIGTAPEGRSFSRVDYGTGPAAHFAFVYPTPGAANRTVDTTVAVQVHPYGTSLTRQPSSVELLFLAIGAGAFFFFFFLHVIRKNKNISYILLGGDEEARV